MAAAPATIGQAAQCIEQDKKSMSLATWEFHSVLSLTLSALS